jgi:hypothetical protein
MGAVREEGPGQSRRVEDQLEQARKGEGPLVTGSGQQVTDRKEGGGVRQQHVQRKQPAQQTQVIDVRSRPPGAAAGSAIPVRTVVYVEVGGADQDQVWELCRQYAASYQGSVHGPHYVIPVRGGRLGTEMEFEKQFLETVQELCEIQDGKIVLKGGALEVQVMRTHVGEGE